MKADFLFVGLNPTHVFKRKRQKHARFMDDDLNTRSIKNTTMLILGCCFPQP